MTVTVELSPEREIQLKHYAEVRKMTIERAILEMTEEVLPTDSYAHLQTTNPEEWGRRFHDFVANHDTKTPVLPDEAMSRESIYK